MDEKTEVSRRMPFIYTTSVWHHLMAKPDKRLVMHMAEVGITAQEIVSNGPASYQIKDLMRETGLSRDGVLSLIGYVCAMHDIGKCHPGFQNSLECGERNTPETMGLIEDRPRHIRHEEYGASVFLGLWRNDRNERKWARLFSRVIRFHHQHKKCGDESRRDEGFFQDENKDEWIAMQKAIDKEMRSIFHVESLPDFPLENRGVIFQRLLGIMIMADWLASGYMFNGTYGYFINRENYINTVRIKCRQFLEDNHMTQKRMPVADFRTLFPFISTPSPMQQTVIDYMKSFPDVKFAIIEDVMGAGKTEAGLYMAESLERNGIYMAMPTNATAQAMQPRLDAMLKTIGCDETVRTGEWKTRCEDEDMMLWDRDAKFRLTARSVIGTADQAIMACRLIKYSSLRLLELASKVILFDEIHSYDAYTMSIIEAFLRWAKAFDIPVIMMSATLPAELKKRLLGVYSDADVQIEPGYPMLTVYDGTVRQIRPERRTKEYDIAFEKLSILDDHDEIVRVALNKTKNGGCLAVIMNTVDDAVSIYRKFKKTTDCDVYLIHGRFPKAVKERKTRELVRLFGKNRKYRPQKAIVVATQILEQSVDVDFDFMMSAIAPIDMLFQRAGRLWRHHKGNGKRTLTVMTPKAKRKICPYETDVIQKTEEKMKDVYKVPEEMSIAVSDIYSGEIINDISRQSKEAMANDGCLGINDIPEKHSLSARNKSVRDGEQSVEIIIGEVPTIRKELLKEYIAEHAVTWRSSVLRDMAFTEGTGILRNIYFVNENNSKLEYSDEYGLVKTNRVDKRQKI